ncbi:MAG: HesA/MoeB/ThiF family protein [Bdellovibrionales bacterium]|nr:HesA/MoeB/ThiF family protein [Bdellovibrionales bacterium]
MPDRYLRQRTLPEIGAPGQEVLARSSVLMVGCGGLASPVLQYLAGAGVGRIGIVDGDRVEKTNLHRQVLFREDQEGSLKVDAAKRNLTQLNSDIKIETHAVFLDSGNAQGLAKDHDLLIDGTDRYETKARLNRLGIHLQKPVIFAGVTAFDAQVLVCDQKSESPCYQCIYPVAPSPLVKNCEEAGVLGPMVGIAGSIQALQAIKLLCGSLEPGNRLLCIDGRNLGFFSRRVRRNPECLACGQADPEWLLREDPEISLSEILASRSRYVIFDVREESETLESPVSGTRSLPLSVISDARGQFTLPPDAAGKTAVFFCRSGTRARQAVSLIRKNGNSEVCFLGDSLDDIRRRL